MRLTKTASCLADPAARKYLSEQTGKILFLAKAILQLATRQREKLNLSLTLKFNKKSALGAFFYFKLLVY
jgi:hypothetical protein